MRIFFTGGSGKAGRHVAPYLAEQRVWSAQTFGWFRPPRRHRVRSVASWMV